MGRKKKSPPPSFATAGTWHTHYVVTQIHEKPDIIPDGHVIGKHIMFLEVLEDIVKEMRKIIPARINYLHQDGPENAAGHIKSALFGTSVSMIIKDGKLLIEDKQDVCFADYDGPQIRTYRVCVMGE